MAIEVFNRYENKYKIDEKTCFRLWARLSEHMKLDAYNRERETYPICNIYYDTQDSHLIRTSLSKPSYKEKLRLRAYGTPQADARVYVELKKKFQGSVNKRRSAMQLGEAYRFLSEGELPGERPYMNGQVLREIRYLLTRWPLKPAVYLSYERRAFLGEYDPELRISFDTDIITRRDDLRLESGSYGQLLLGDGQWLMEVKAAGAVPVWLSRLLCEYEIYPCSFSKYGAEYQGALSAAAPRRERPGPVPEAPRPLYWGIPLGSASA